MRTLVRAALMATILAAGGSPGRAAVYNVDTTIDLPDALPGDGVCMTGSGSCSLRAAVMTANANPGSDTINIPADASAYTLTYTGVGEDAALTGDLDIADDVDIVGAGAKSVTIDGNATDRVFHIVQPVAVSISGVTITNGGAINAGAGIYNATAASLTLEGVRVTGNVSQSAAGAAGGGGVTAAGPTLISDSSIDNNHVIGVVNAIGGGMVLNAAVLTNVTVSGNTLTPSTPNGSGIYIGGATSLNNVTVSLNSGGPGVTRGPGGSSPTVRNSILAANSPSDCSASSVPIVSLGYTLFGTLSGCAVTSGPGDIVNPTPMLGALADNGGDTPTHALLAGSPAIATGSPDVPGSMTATACEALDQRGGPRGVPIGTRCDIGAYETGCGNQLIDPSENCESGVCCTAACVFAANLTPCPADGNECTHDQCNGASEVCQHPSKANGTSCVDDLNQCTLDACDGGLCQHDPQTGAACDDGDACTSGDTCSGVGVCTPGTGCPACTVCTGPLGGCMVGTTPSCMTPPEKKSSFSVKLGTTPAQTSFKWKWAKGPTVTAGDLGDPVAGSSGYVLCIFDQDGAALSFQADIAPGGTCGSAPCWRPAKTGFKFSDKSAAQDGVSGVQVFAGDLGKAKLQVSGKGAAVPATNLPYTPTVIVELHRTDAPICWSSEFASHVLKTSNLSFKAVSDP